MRKILHKIIYITLIFSLFACKNSNKNISTDIVNNPMSAKESDAKNTAIIEFEKHEHAFGSVEQGERLSYSFSLKIPENEILLFLELALHAVAQLPTIHNSQYLPKKREV